MTAASICVPRVNCGYLLSLQKVLLDKQVVLTQFSPLQFSPVQFSSVQHSQVQSRSVQFNPVQFSSISQSCPTLCDPMDCSTPGFPIYHQLPELAQTHSSSQWCHPPISFSAILFFCLQSFPGSGSFSVSWLFASHGQSTGVSASTSVLPVNIQDWFPLGWSGFISLQSKGLSRVFSKTTVQKHQFFSTQLSPWSNSHIHTWLLEKP